MTGSTVFRESFVSRCLEDLLEITGIPSACSTNPSQLNAVICKLSQVPITYFESCGGSPSLVLSTNDSARVSPLLAIRKIREQSATLGLLQARNVTLYPCSYQANLSFLLELRKKIHETCIRYMYT
ncbi:uncharacterized protein LOC112494625 [Cephus cinctus]|uniref:Uncharacterized protein LOC112494625 n=1 Tax=Cephus cinctus TaxID=211228 RepID=A0AAJ7W300_CEPCN|nr:uncharacterized protein LOC112494625 [Cephus cinctus]